MENVGNIDNSFLFLSDDFVKINQFFRKYAACSCVDVSHRRSSHTLTYLDNNSHVNIYTISRKCSEFENLVDFPHSLECTTARSRKLNKYFDE